MKSPRASLGQNADSAAESSPQRSTLVPSAATAPGNGVQEDLQEVAPLPPEIASLLKRELRAMLEPGGLCEHDALRYELFSRRLQAAEDGWRPSVEWAMEWYRSEVEPRLKAEAEATAAQIEATREIDAALRRERAAGKAGNPYYQAFLDTVEDPAGIENNVPYFIFHHAVTKAMEESKTTLSRTEFTRQYADERLSERVKRERAAAKNQGS